MKNGFLFPGQGSQGVGMGKELYQTMPKAKRLLDDACELLGYDLRNLMFEGPEEKLTKTQYAQPAIYVCSAMYLEKAKEQGLSYEYVAGHSLGEYAALYAAGVFSFLDGLALIHKRGEAMGAENGKGTMAAVLGMTEEELKPILDARKDVVMANLNTRTQIVISGTESGIDEVAGIVTEKDEVKVKKLMVSAPFHSPWMANAAQIMKKEIETLDFKKPTVFVVPNVTGKPTKDIGEIKAGLVSQITGQVRWYDSILAMKEAGVEEYYEIGNGSVLRRMNKGITLRPKCSSL